MSRCEDYPCCGHEPGCCPDFDESGQQINMKCVCGKILPTNNRYSCCSSCMDGYDGTDERPEDDHHAARREYEFEARAEIMESLIAEGMTEDEAEEYIRSREDDRDYDPPEHNDYYDDE